MLDAVHARFRWDPLSLGLYPICSLAVEGVQNVRNRQKDGDKSNEQNSLSGFPRYNRLTQNDSQSAQIECQTKVLTRRGWSVYTTSEALGLPLGRPYIGMQC